MKRFRFVLGLIVTILTPGLALAHDFTQTDGLFFNANSALYRQKTVNRPWQLVDLPGLTIKQSVTFHNQLYLVAEGATGQSLYQQDHSLRFTASSVVPPSSSLTLKVVGDWLVIFASSGNGSSLYVSSGDQLQLVIPALIATPEDLDRLVVINGQLSFISPTDQTVTVWRYQNGWQIGSQLACTAAKIIRQPQLLLECATGQLFYVDPANSWQTLNFPLVKSVKTSSDLLVDWDKSNDHLVHIWQSGVATTINLPNLAFSQVQQTVVSGSRILFQSAGLWSELMWQSNPPTLLQLSSSANLSLVESDLSGQLFLSGGAPFLSTSAGAWQPIVTTGNFNHAHLTSLGWLLWQTDSHSGSLTQFAPAGSTNFTKVNLWSSTTSPIQTVSFGDEVSYVSVITQSGAGNVNLYQTTDYTHWSRLTLPTKPTVATTINDARALPAGSLVELEGVLTIGPGIVASDVSYLADDQSGIQLFLSQTVGKLPSTVNKRAVITGEISTSQVKRVSLDSLADLEIGSAGEVVMPTITADQVANYLGRLVNLQGTASDVDTDTLSFSDLVKLHFTAAKTSFQKDDQLVVPAVVDWNSSSGQIEAWATSANYQLISRLASVPTSSAASTSSSTTATTTKKSSPAPKTKTTTASVTSSPSPTVLTAVSKHLAPTSSNPVLVASATSTNQPTTSQTTILAIAALLAGLISMQGRRFRQLIER